MQNRRSRARGFSLVELVIVIVIIGVIAAIAIPRMSRGAKGAGESALIGNLAVLRNAIELYATEHDNAFPGAKEDGDGGAAKSAAAMLSQLTKYSNEAGEVSDTKDTDHPYGPYLRRGIPAAPVGVNKGKDTVLIDDTNSPPAVNTVGGEGWVYNPITGDVIVNSDADNDAETKTYNEY